MSSLHKSVLQHSFHLRLSSYVRGWVRVAAYSPTVGACSRRRGRCREEARYQLWQPLQLDCGGFACVLLCCADQLAKDDALRLAAQECGAGVKPHLLPA
eukprot:366061-Chlamydomonas_euryale.AAC.9